MGRAMLFMLLQFLILIPALGIPAAIGGIAFLLSGFSLARVRRHVVAGARGRIAAGLDPARLDVRAVRSQYRDAGMRADRRPTRPRSCAVGRQSHRGSCRRARRGVAWLF